MPRKQLAKRRKNKTGAEPDENRSGTASVSKKNLRNRNTGAIYKAGPVLTMPSGLLPGLSLHTSGEGEPSRDSAKGSNLRLEGRTDAVFDGGSFETQNVRVSAGKAVPLAVMLIHAFAHGGILVARFHVNTNVTLPSVNDFPDLTPCQRTRVQHAINTILAPHEQQHVQAFRQYNGATRTPFDVTLCRSEFDSAIQSLFETQESTRRAAAQAASDALDPFHFDVDLNCEEPR
ncbi:MAG: hypothetical protein NVV73_00890 [Cellvibrionaceae bacterium]|nr:hypothetical protein [Cellvibrionaceae bacterium]